RSYSQCSSSYTSRCILPSSFFSNATATTAIYTLSLHVALPIFRVDAFGVCHLKKGREDAVFIHLLYPNSVLGQIHERNWGKAGRSEEHTSELQSRGQLVCRLLLEKKNNCHKRARLYRKERRSQR